MARHIALWRSALGLFLALLLLVISIGVSPALAGGGPAFPDLSNHWAATAVTDAVAAGYVNGYPDGTFRPNANVTRAEFVKLLVKAGGIPLMPPNSWQIFNDVDGHWVEQQGYLDTAGAYGIVIRSDYFGAFEPDRPITRREAAVQAVRLLGRQHVVEQLDGNITLADGPAMPLWERRYIEEAMQGGMLTGYPDNTFRDQQPITRAEAVVIAQRAAKAMKAGEDPSLKLTVNGMPVTSKIPLAVRSGYVYTPAEAIYGGLGHTTMFYRQTDGDPRLFLFPGNDSFLYSNSRVLFPAGAAYAYLRTADSQLQDSATQQATLLAPTYLDQGRLMIPVAAVSGDGSLPYAIAHYDSTAGAVTVTITDDWPGYHLPQTPAEAQLKFFHVQQPVALQPGLSDYVSRPDVVDAGGNQIGPADPDSFTIHMAVDPVSPVRLQESAGGPLLMSLDVPKYSSTDARLVVDQSQSPIPEGTWNVTYSAPSYKPVTLAVSVSDHRPAQLAVNVTPVAAGQTQTVTVKLLDSRGRVVDQSYHSDYENAGPTVTVTLPDHSTAQAAPVVHTDLNTGRPFILVHGVGTFTFTPSSPGTYHYAAHRHTPYSSQPAYGDFDATADLTVTQ